MGTVRDQGGAHPGGGGNHGWTGGQEWDWGGVGTVPEKNLKLDPLIHVILELQVPERQETTLYPDPQTEHCVPLELDATSAAVPWADTLGKF